MVKQGKIAHYRETLDKTLAADDLADEKKLATLVKDQILRSSDGKINDYIDNVVEKRVAEVSNFLEMLRSASTDHSEPGTTQHASWKLKQDTEEFRVMYREGPVGSPFHSLLVEGYIDAPLDVCLCVSWETALYPRWFPEMLIPTFKVVTAKSLQKVMVGEEISLIRVKLSWPMSSREAVLHYFAFEYMEDGLIIVLINTISDVNNIRMETDGFTSEGIPEAGNTVRIDLVGGFALQRVTESRSYFRTIGNMDIKLDFVPPSLINFISRQLIGSGFRFYQKTVASVSKGDEAFAKVLSGPLYHRIREALCSKGEAKGNVGRQNFDNCVTVSSREQKPDLGDVLRKDNGCGQADKSTDECQSIANKIVDKRRERDNIKVEKHLGDVFKVEEHNTLLNGHVNGCSPQYKPATEIEEVEIRGTEGPLDNGEAINHNFKRVLHDSTDQLQSANIHKNVPISPQVEKALGTLDKLISVVREGRVKPLGSGQPGAQLEGSEATSSTMGKHVQWTNQEVISAEVVTAAAGVSTNAGALAGLRPANPNFPAQGSHLDVMSPVQNPPIASWSRNSLSAGNSPVVDNSEVNGIHEVDKKTERPRKWKICCLHLVSGKLVS